MTRLHDLAFGQKPFSNALAAPAPPLLKALPQLKTEELALKSEELAICQQI